MPIITIESSVHLPADRRSAALRTLVEAVNDLLAIAPPTQLRLRIVDVPVELTAIGDLSTSNDVSWIVAFAHVLEGRPDEQIASFIADFAGTLGSVFGVDVANVRVLVQHYAKQNWGIGRRTAAAMGR